MFPILSLFFMILKIMLSGSLTCIPCCSTQKFLPTPTYFFYRPGEVDDSLIGDNEELIEEDSDAEFKEE